MNAQVPARLAAALAAAPSDRLVLDLTGMADAYRRLTRELPGAAVRFAVKSCPVDEVLTCLAEVGAGFDAASPAEIAQVLRLGVPARLIHYGNTVKSDAEIAEAHRLGIRTFATDSVEDVTAVAAQAPGARVFCRLATSGDGALWGLSHKFGCSPDDAVRVLTAARAAGLTPAGLSVHVGSQQMTAEAWTEAAETLADTLLALREHGIAPDHVNLGGGLPAAGYLDRRGRPLEPPLDKMFAVIRDGMDRLRHVNGGPLAFVVEPGRHLVADHGAIRAHVSRLTTRRGPGGRDARWLYLSVGKFNGLYEMDQLCHRLVFPGRTPGEDRVPAVVAGPTCDSDDAYADPAQRVPRGLASGDPVWILSAGAYATSYMTRGFNGFPPLPYAWAAGDGKGDATPAAPATRPAAARDAAPAAVPAEGRER
ncbi:type III PLP-dependent enzyme [Streptomyces sp. NPDC005805]|uniref:type III PLP-dependent enzyme n=1 Tax=Streptomyces sp. NPDC005805 TaxID=3157068 RepID=UPI0033F75DE0